MLQRSLQFVIWYQQLTSKQYALWLFAAWFNVGLWPILISLRDYTSCVCLSTHLLSQWSLFKINPQMKLISTASRLNTLLIYQTDLETSGIFSHISWIKHEYECGHNISAASRLNTLLISQTDLETSGIFLYKAWWFWTSKSKRNSL